MELIVMLRSVIREQGDNDSVDWKIDSPHEAGNYNRLIARKYLKEISRNGNDLVISITPEGRKYIEDYDKGKPF